MTTTPVIRPQDWARMSWHARQRYLRHHPHTPPPPGPQVTRPMHVIVGLLDQALNEHGDNRGRAGTTLDRALEHADALARTDVSGNALAFELGVAPSTLRRWRRALAEAA